MTSDPAAKALPMGYAGVTVRRVPLACGPYPFIGALDPATQMFALDMAGGNQAAPYDIPTDEDPMLLHAVAPS